MRVETITMCRMDSPWLELRGLAKRYGSREAVRGISLSLARGEIVGLLGPNGAGKSTLIGMLTGLLSPSEGEVLWEGLPIGGRMAEWRRSMGVVLEDLSLFEFLTVEENIRFVGQLAGLAADEVDRRCSDLLTFLDMDAHAGTPAVEASQGTRRKLAFALAVLRSPRVLLLDEALNGVDALTASRLKALLRRLAAAGVTVILSSHALDAMEGLVDRCIIVHQGKAALDSTMSALRDSGRSLEQVYTSIISTGQEVPVLSWAVP
jgi:ABC-2 type transport system ATP-binding protein